MLHESYTSSSSSVSSEDSLKDISGKKQSTP